MDRDLHPRISDPVTPPAGHSGAGTYVRVAAILTVITALEFAVIYIRAFTPILVPLLLVLSAAKFALVVLFFMHLRDDSRALAAVFMGPLLVAIGFVVALTALTGVFLGYGR